MRIFASLLFAVFTVLCIVVGGYAFSFFLLGANERLIEKFTAYPLLAQMHIYGGAIALLCGPIQFHKRLRARFSGFHRTVGKIYVAAILCSGTSGLYLAAYSEHGWISHLGFGSLSAIWLITTYFAFMRIRQRDIAAHRRWMIRSFALTFAAVTLRFELLLMTHGFGWEFSTAYKIVAWSCWVPNLWIALLWTRPRPLAEPARMNHDHRRHVR